MSVRVHLPGYLQPFADGKSKVTLAASPRTAGEALAALWQLHPGVRDRVMTETGEVRPHVNVFVNGESIRFTGGLETPVAEGAQLHIVPAVSGG
ncbi:MAG: MoaD/ThiS family protein [Deltaproteobacteria bacterium]|nr:MoaD/ThiS family protein [Deltaproteobacteria bacterium]